MASSFPTRSLQKRWLGITAITVGSFGPVFFLGAMEPTMEPARWTLDLLAWPPDGATTYAGGDIRFLSAIAGGILLGWGVLIWCLRALAFDLAPEGVRKSVLVGLLAWFVLDNAGSIASGNAPNVVFNTLVLLVAAGPLWVRARA